MSISPTDSRLFSSLFRDEKIGDIFSDEALVRYLVAVEVALAKAQARLGVIPHDAADIIAARIAPTELDLEELHLQTSRDGFPIIELVRQLREQIGGEAASYLHWGATTQDIMDTALVLQLRASLGVLEEALSQALRNLAVLVDKHRRTLMAGRTHSQQALPITFGLKVAGWLAPLLRHKERLDELKLRLLVVQFGGAAGTMASLESSGLKVQEELAVELRLGVPLMPWHTQRDNLAELANWLSLVSGSLAKMAQDVILLAQTEVGEVRESADNSRGGSSTMPQKSNPIQSELIIAAARANASLLSSMHQALIQEHERATHGWQLEWLSLPQMIALTSSVLGKAVWLSEHLVVDQLRMQANVKASNGLMLAEAVSFALADHMSRTDAKRAVKAAVQIAIKEDRHLIAAMREQTEAPIDWDALSEESNYLGASDALIDSVLNEVNKKGEKLHE